VAVSRPEASSQSVCSSSGRLLGVIGRVTGLHQFPVTSSGSINNAKHAPWCLGNSAGFASKVKIEYVEVSQPKWDPYQLPPTNYVQLLNAIHLAPTLGRLEELMQPELLERLGG